jgi:hypothetical protein
LLLLNLAPLLSSDGAGLGDRPEEERAISEAVPSRETEGSLPRILLMCESSIGFNAEFVGIAYDAESQGARADD